MLLSYYNIHNGIYCLIEEYDYQISRWVPPLHKILITFRIYSFWYLICKIFSNQFWLHFTLLLFSFSFCISCELFGIDFIPKLLLANSFRRTCLKYFLHYCFFFFFRYHFAFFFLFCSTKIKLLRRNFLRTSIFPKWKIFEMTHKKGYSIWKTNMKSLNILDFASIWLEKETSVISWEALRIQIQFFRFNFCFDSSFYVFQSGFFFHLLLFILFHFVSFIFIHFLILFYSFYFIFFHATFHFHSSVLFHFNFFSFINWVSGSFLSLLPHHTSDVSNWTLKCHS